MQVGRRSPGMGRWLEPQLSGHLALDPCHQHLHDILLFRGAQGAARRDTVPFGKASPAAAARGVLGDEDRMSPHRGLVSVIVRKGRGQACADKLLGMVSDGRKPLSFDVAALRGPKPETAPEVRSGESRKEPFQHLLQRRRHFVPRSLGRKIRSLLIVRALSSRGRRMVRNPGSRVVRRRCPRHCSGRAALRKCGKQIRLHGLRGLRRMDMSPPEGHQSIKRTFDSSRGLASGDSSG